MRADAVGLLQEIATERPELLLRDKPGPGRPEERLAFRRSQEAAYVVLELQRRHLGRREAEEAVYQVMGVAKSAIDKYTDPALQESMPDNRPLIARYRAIKERHRYAAAQPFLSRRQQIAWEGMKEGAEPVKLPARTRRRRS
jgi:hypothetical protein